MFPLKNLARKGLSPGYDLCVNSGYIIVLYKALMSWSPEWRGINFQNWVIFDPGADLGPVWPHHLGGILKMLMSS